MKYFTKNLIIFSVCLIVLTIGLRISLSTFLQHRMFVYLWPTAVAYAVIVFICGWVFGKHDRQHLPLYDIGLRFLFHHKQTPKFHNRFYNSH